MLSSVFLSGRLGKLIRPNLRYVEIDRVVPEKCGSYEVDRVKVRSMLSEKSQFYTALEGSGVVIKGRLQVDEEEGLIVVAEIEEIRPAKPIKNK